jgi:hypothetical protein
MAATTRATAASKTSAVKSASTPARTCPSWQSKTQESGAYQADKFNLFHT